MSSILQKLLSKDQYIEYQLDRIKAKKEAELAAQSAIEQQKALLWPTEYVNRTTGRVYKPHSQEEYDFVFNDFPRNGLLKGGEGGGKSVALIIKNLERLRRFMAGIMVSPDLPHFKKSLWPEFRNWCPWDKVIERHQYRQHEGWEPTAPFSLVFTAENGRNVTLACGGIKETEVMSWEGPNVSFASFDEGRRHNKPVALKVLTGRVRIPGPNGEPPQFYIATTPRKHWLFDYFGPIHCLCHSCHKSFDIEQPMDYKISNCPNCGSDEFSTDDPLLAFKKSSRVVTLKTSENIINLDEAYLEERASSLTEKERRVLLEAAWEDYDDTDRFLPDMSLWDQCEDILSAPTVHEPLVISVDAGVSSDSFGIVGISEHPKKPGQLAVRFVREWIPPKRGKIDFLGTEEEPGPERILRWLCNDKSDKGKTELGKNNHNVMMITYDPYQLHSMMTEIENENLAWVEEFNQGTRRLEADKQLYDLIIHRKLYHNGYRRLRQHIDNADRKRDATGRKFRLVKRETKHKIDLAVCLSQACHAFTESVMIGVEGGAVNMAKS